MHATIQIYEGSQIDAFRARESRLSHERVVTHDSDHDVASLVRRGYLPRCQPPGVAALRGQLTTAQETNMPKDNKPTPRLDSIDDPDRGDR
jgi:hypothetical protein